VKSARRKTEKTLREVRVELRSSFQAPFRGAFSIFDHTLFATLYLLLTMVTANTANTDVSSNPAAEGGFIVSRLDAVINWIRANSIWPMPMGVACCAIELMASGGARFDIARFGAEVMRFSPRQSDCMIVAGTITYKMAPHVRRIYDQMPSPKWVIAMGACASSGGMYRSYATLQGVDRILPVDVYISGCPPRPEAILDALVNMQNKIRREHSTRALFSKNQ